MKLSNQITKVVSLAFFSLISTIKIVCLVVLNEQSDSHCIAGWHLNEDLCNQLILLTVGMIPDILMIMCIGIGMAFTTSNVGADPGAIVYNFIVGILTFCSVLPIFRTEDCKSDNFATINSVGICAAIAGILQIINGIICLIFLAPEERFEAEE